MPQPRPGSRSIVSLVIAAFVLGTFTLSPVAAHFNQNTKHLGRHAWRDVIRNKVFNKRQANRRFVNERKILAATVSNVGEPAPVLESGRGVRGLADSADGTAVMFHRKIDNCTNTISSEGTGTTATTVPSSNPRKVIGEIFWENHETPVTGGTFHLVVVCP